ncbi:MAG TPA: thioredoxin domain-containing protein [Chromatiales bacterium]|nr:thioredoxin domain-containing protein [Chromatiales bacterium]
MLYTQALLARVYLHGAQLTGESGFARTVDQIMHHVLKDMTSDDGGFYSATDADSDGGEGRFFVWTPAQLRAALSRADAQFAIDAWGVTDEGNFDGANVLYLPVPVETLARRHSMSTEAAYDRLDRIRATLYEVRESRPHPARDDKIVTAWNGMMILALAEAAIAFDKPQYAKAALKAGERLWRTARRPDGHLWRASLDGRMSVDASQEDYAWFADACVQLYDLTDDPRWLERARQLAETMNALFWDNASGGYFMSRANDDLQLMARPKDDYDDATPSGNAVALHVLARLAARTADYAPSERAQALLAAFAGDIDDNPAIYGYLLTARALLNHGAAGPLQYAARGAVRLSGFLDGDAIVIELSMRPGWHVNAHRVLQDDLVPTTVEPQKDVPGWTLQVPQYPQPVVRKLGFSEDELALYEKRVRISLPAQRSEAGPAAAIVPVSVELQACDDSRCLPPEQHVLNIPVSASFDRGRR